jgi:hypothetical protein
MNRVDTSTMPSPSQVADLWDSCDKALMEERRNYWLNLSFYCGQQWVRWEADTRRVRLLSEEETKNCTTINKLGPATENLLGRLLKRDLAFETKLTNGDDVARRGGKLTEFILEEDRRERDWEEARLEEVMAVLMGGTSAVSVEWDPDAGPVVTQAPEDSSDLNLGMAKLTGLTIAEFSLEPHVRRQLDATWWIRCLLLPVEQAQDRWNLSKPPPADGTAATSPMQGRLLGSQSGTGSDAELCRVLTMFKRPTRRSQGYSLTVIGNETVAESRTWPFPFPELNLYTFHQLKPESGKWTGRTFVSQVRGPQFHYNMVRSVSLTHSDKVSNARLMVPEGAVDDPDEAFTDEAGDVVTYHPVENGEIKYLDPPAYQRQLAQEAERIESEIADILHTHATSQGEIVGDRNSGLALSLVAEKDDSPLGVMARDQALGWGRIASMVAKLYEANAIEQRTTRVTTPNGVVMKRDWTGADLHGQTAVTVPLEATMPHSRVAHQAMITNIAGTLPNAFANIDPVTLFKLLDLPNADMVPGILDPDRKRAAWENEMMAEGRPCVPEPWHNHAKHIADHNGQRNDPDYESWTEEAQHIMEMHIAGHEKMGAEEVATQANLERGAPGLSQVPQGDNPPGSAVPPPLSLIQGGQGGAPPAPITPPGATPAPGQTQEATPA